jgi:hypothetical protein
MAGSGEPLVGRGSARRAGPRSRGDQGSSASGSEPASDSSNRDPLPRSVPRPPLSRRGGGRWQRPIATTVPGARLGVAIGLVVVLGVAWIAVGQQGSGEAAPEPKPRETRDTRAPRTATTVVPPPPVSVERIVAMPAWVPTALAATCRARARGVQVVVDCNPGRGVVSLRYRSVASVAALRTAFARAGTTGRPGTGPPVCAEGGAEERAWSAAAAPTAPLGRYRCSRVAGRARIVWSTEHVGGGTDAGPDVAVIGVATRADGDLRSLYQWWTTVPGPISFGPTVAVPTAG